MPPRSRTPQPASLNARSQTPIIIPGQAAGCAQFFPLVQVRSAGRAVVVALRLVVVAVCWVAPTFSSGVYAADHAESQTVEVRDVEGRTGSGPLVEWTESRLRLGGTSGKAWESRAVLNVRWPANQRLPQESDSAVLLANGDLWGVQLERVTEETLTGRWLQYPTWSTVAIPLERVCVAALPEGGDSGTRRFRLERYLTRATKSDVLLLRNGDALAGEWTSFAENRFHWKTSAGTTVVDASAARAVLPSPELASVPKTVGLRLLCQLTDGSLCTLQTWRVLADGRLAGKTVCGPQVEFSRSAVVEAWVLGGQAVYLSDSEPRQYRFQPYLRQTWPLKTDRAVSGGPLRIRGVEYPKGLGVHSRSEVEYALGGKYRTFLTRIGIDDGAAGKGSVRFRILVEGKLAYESPEITGAMPVVVVPPVTVAGAQLLTLVVDFGGQGDIQDHANWCEAVLIER